MKALIFVVTLALPAAANAQRPALSEPGVSPDGREVASPGSMGYLSG